MKATETLTVPDVGVNPSWKCADCVACPPGTKGGFECRVAGFRRQASQAVCLLPGAKLRKPA